MRNKENYKEILRQINNDEIRYNKEVLLIEAKSRIENTNKQSEIIVCKTFIFKFGYLKGRDRYDLANDIIGMTIKNKDFFIENTEDIYLYSCVLNEILKISTCMNLYLETMLNIVYEYIEINNNIQVFIEQLVLSLRKMGDIEKKNKFEVLFKNNIDILFGYNEILIMENILEILNKNKIECFNQDIVINKLIVVYFKSLEEVGDLKNITNLTKVIELSKKIGKKEVEEKALALLEKNIRNTNFEKNTIKSDDNLWIESILEKQQKLLDIFFVEYNIKNIIRNIDSNVCFDNILIYNPAPNKEILESEDDNSVFLNLVSSINLDNNKVTSIKSIKDIIYKNVIYDGHIQYNIMPYMNCIYNYNIQSLKEIRDFFYDCGLCECDIYRYYLYIEKYFSHDSSVEFTTLGSILIEKILRYIYKELKHKSIISKRKDCKLQVEVNLQDILKDNEIKNFLNDDLHEYLRYILIDEDGLNLRNKIMHGIIELKELDIRKMYIVMHIILVLLSKIKYNLDFKKYISEYFISSLVES